MLLPLIKKKYLDKELERSFSNRLLYTFYFFIQSISNIFVMMIMMTMNGYVNLCVGLGLTIGYLI